MIQMQLDGLPQALAESIGQIGLQIVAEQLETAVTTHLGRGRLAIAQVTGQTDGDGGG